MLTEAANYVNTLTQPATKCKESIRKRQTLLYKKGTKDIYINRALSAHLHKPKFLLLFL